MNDHNWFRGVCFLVSHNAAFLLCHYVTKLWAAQMMEPQSFPSFAFDWFIVVFDEFTFAACLVPSDGGFLVPQNAVFRCAAL